MINPGYVLTMARYNAWQNKQLRAAMEAMPEDALRADRGAFFGSILGTANHILWADMLWMARFQRQTPPDVPFSQCTHLMPTCATWSAARFRMDGRILLWAEKLHALDLVGDLTWFSGLRQRNETRAVSGLVMHLFNHQTHHRGQIHAMLTAAGVAAPETDLFFMPQDGPWL